MQPTDLAVAGCGVCMMLPGTILPPGMGVLFFWSYTSVIFRYGRNFSRPTVYYLFKVGRLSPGSYCHSEPAFCNAVFMESMVSSHLTFVPSTCVVPPVVPA